MRFWRRAKRVCMMGVLCAIGILSTGTSTALGATPSTLPTLDSVVKLPKISIKTKGLSAKEAFEAISRETGVPIVSRTWKNSFMIPGMMPGEKEKKVVFEEDAFDFTLKRRLNFDIENASFWEAACRIADYSGVGVSNVVGGTVVLDRKGWMTAEKRRCFLDNAMVCASLSRRVEVKAGDPWAFDLKTIDSHLSVYLFPDPRVFCISQEKTAVDDAWDPKGKPVVLKDKTQFDRNNQGENGEREYDCGYVLSEEFELENGPLSNARIEVLKGHFDVEVANETRAVEMPLDQLGFAKEEGDWRVKLEYFEPGYREGQIAILMGLEPRRVGIDRLKTIGNLIQVFDERGVSMDLSRYDSLQRTATGGVRQWFYINESVDGLEAEAKKGVVHVPLGIAKARVEFELRDLEWPAVIVKKWEKTARVIGNSEIEEMLGEEKP